MTGPAERRSRAGRAASVVFAAGCGTTVALYLSGNYWGAGSLIALTFWVAYALIDLHHYSGQR